MKFWNVNNIFSDNPPFFNSNSFSVLNASSHFTNLDYSNFVYPLFSKTATLAYYDFLITGFIYFSKILPSCFTSDNILLFTQYYELVQGTDVLSSPITKLYYPEPFIASPSFVHEDLWFIHILHFQHWLWFFFITLIMFYFIAFINCIHHCNARNFPKRETRGASRSKCADIITACVPVSWAIAIIISETVDSTDYYDGFGTGQIVIGIRAYQWGWEYFYPKTLDLNYSVSPSYSSLTGNSLKYSNSSSELLDSNSFWKAYQNKTSKNVSNSPSYLLLTPQDNSKVSSNVTFNNLGLSSVADSSAFKKIQYFTKSNPNLWNSDSSSSSTRFNKLSHLYLNNTRFNDSYSYGTFRQHNYTSLNSNLSSFDSLLDLKGTNKFLNFVLSLNKNSNNDVADFFNSKNILAPRTEFNFTSLNSVLPLYKSLFYGFHSNEGSNFNGLIFYQNYTDVLNGTTDFKSRSNSSKYGLWNRTLMKLGKSNKLTFDQPHRFKFSFSKIDLSSNFFEKNQKITNSNVTYAFKDLRSSSLSFLNNDKNPRNTDNLNLRNRIFNLTPSNNFSSTFSTLNNSTLDGYYSSSKFYWINQTLLKSLLGSEITFPFSHTPVYSNNLHQSTKEFDRYPDSLSITDPLIFSSKEETSPNYLFSSYWLTHWSRTLPNNRFENLLNSLRIKSLFYLPQITEYSEYDFRNWQALEMLEDSLWESAAPYYLSDEYLTIKSDYNSKTLFKKQEVLYNKGSRRKKYKSGLYYSLPGGNDTNSYLYNSPLFNEDSSIKTNYILKKNFKMFPNELFVDTMDESYENFKQLNTLFFSNRKFSLLFSYFNIYPLSYTQVLNNFRDSYQDFLWNRELKSDQNFTNSKSLNSASTRNLNLLKLRSTARNSIVTYNAMQKVFKSRFDEGRSNARVVDFSNSFVTYPFISQEKTLFESILGKNKESFFEESNYITSNKDFFTNLYTISNSVNIPYLDVPFLVSLKSDASRYLWFDWQAKWSSMEIQPSSAARYSLTGVPYLNKGFEYNTQKIDVLNDSDNYLNRLVKARKNYLPAWSSSPYFFSRVTNWYKNYNFLNAPYISFFSLKELLYTSRCYWESDRLLKYSDRSSTPTYSGVNTPIRSSWRPVHALQGYYYTSSVLSDLLSKRENIYRLYFNNKGFVGSLPLFLTASPDNTLFKEVKTSFLFTDPVNFSGEITRELLYNNSNFLKLDLFKNVLTTLGVDSRSLPFNLSMTHISFLHFLFNDFDSSGSFINNQDLYKNQFRPMKRGAANMIRLQATGVMSLPVEIRLHILASSRDVIHSWAVPSAGIKIDCVPGYSSHKVTIFFVSGIFWGQCMEICGRFHHWMPIIVYFVKQDVFFLWCIHFMHYDVSSDIFTLNDKKSIERIKVSSFDKTSWVNLYYRNTR